MASIENLKQLIAANVNRYQRRPQIILNRTGKGTMTLDEQLMWLRQSIDAGHDGQAASEARDIVRYCRQLLNDENLDLDLNEWIQIDDALNAINQGQNSITFIYAHKLIHREHARIAYAKALDLVAHHESLNKAINFVQEQIEKFRD